MQSWSSTKGCEERKAHIQNTKPTTTHTGTSYSPLKSSNSLILFQLNSDNSSHSESSQHIEIVIAVRLDYQSLVCNKQSTESLRWRAALSGALLPDLLAADALRTLSVICRQHQGSLTFSPPTRKRSTAAMLTLMLWQRSWRTSLMEAPGRRVMEEQEPSGTITLQCLGARSHTPTEWRLSD